MKLYYAPGACSLSPHIVLREAGIPIELKKVSLGSKQIDGGGDYLKINPNGYVPALQLDDGQVLTEGPAIVQYIADNKPGSNLAPPNGTLARARLQGWLNFIATELHKSFSPLFNKAASADWKQAASTLLNKRLSWLDGELNGKTYLTGDQFTVADAYLFTILNWTGFVGIDRTQWPQLDAYHARVAARPQVQEALKAEGLSK